MASVRWPLVLLLLSLAAGERHLRFSERDLLWAKPSGADVQSGWGAMMQHFAEESVMEMKSSDAEVGVGDYHLLIKAFPQYRFNHKYRFFARHSKLGEGAYGTVWRGVEMHGQQRKLAVKQQPTRSHVCPKCRTRSELEQEYEFQRLVSGVPYVMPVINAKWQPGPGPTASKSYYYIVIPLARGVANAYDLLQYTDKFRMKPDEIRLVMAQLAVAVQGMHKAGVAHLDLKLDNLLVDGVLAVDRLGYGLPKLLVADFGIAAKLSLPSSRDAQEGALPPKRAGGTPGYMAPEVLLTIAHAQTLRPSRHVIRSNADWYSFALVACSLAVAHAANSWTSPCNFQGVTSDVKIRDKLSVLSAIFRVKVGPGFGTDLLSLMRNFLLKAVPEERFSSFNSQDFDDPYSNAFWQHRFWHLDGGRMLDFSKLAAAAGVRNESSDVES